MDLYFSIFSVFFWEDVRLQILSEGLLYIPDVVIPKTNCTAIWIDKNSSVTFIAVGKELAF